MNTTITPLLSALLLVAGAGSAAFASTPATTAGGEVGPVYLDSTDIRYLESYPVQVVLGARGSLPTPCHELVYEVQDLGDRIDVQLWSLVDPGQICVQVLEPFEESIPLGSFTAADLPVFVNGEQVGTIEIGETPTSSGSGLLAAGWSFGMCAGYCYADLVIDGEALELTGASRESVDPIFVNQGSITERGREALDASVSGLGDAELEPSYGCPDCADGGAAYLQLEQEGSAVRIDMEFGAPPAELAETYALAMSLIDALQACTATDLVVPSDDCVPYETA